MSAILNPASQPPAPHEVPPAQKVAAPPTPPRRTWLWVGLGAAVAVGIGLWQWNARREEARQTVVVTPIRTATNQALRAITVGNLPSVIAITPAPRR